MKKTYSKPQIMFEDFTLTTNIASGCDVMANNPSLNQCGIDFSGLMVFLSEETGCKGDGIVEDLGGDGEYAGICYHVFSNDQNLFNS